MIDDETFYMQELNYYTKLYFDYLIESNKPHDDYTQDYLKGFVQYCKDYIYYYAEKLTKLAR